MPKKVIRSKMLALRSSLGLADWQAASSMAQHLLLGMPEFRNASSVALYSPIRQELDTRLLFERCRSDGKRVFYPVVCGEILAFREIESKEQLAPGCFGIMEPCSTAESTETPEHIDLMLVPGVAFDRNGHRLGFGKGYYDRYLASIEQLPVLIGFCHDFQLFEKLPSEEHDIKMNHVVTELRVLSMAVTDCP